MQKKLTLSLVATALVTNLQAQDVTLAPLEVTSTAIKTNELRSTDAVEVYTQKDIEKAHVQNVYEFLNKTTSINTSSNFGNPYTQLLDLHGYGGNGYQNIVVTVNGRKLNNIDGIPQLLSSISPNQIAKIEIVKSSGIVESGDGANAGAINIITKNSNDKEIGFYAGTYNTFDGNFYVGHTSDNLSINLSGEAQKNGGIRYIDTNGNKDASKFSNFAFDMAYNPIDPLELRLNAQTSNIDVNYAGYMTKAEYDKNIYQKGSGFPNHQLFTSDVIGAGASYDITNKLTINGDFSHEYKTSAYAGSNPSKYTYNSYNVNLKYIDDALSIKAGVDGFNGDRKGGGNILTKDNLGGFITAQYKIAKHTLKAGYRYEKVTYEYVPATGSSLKQNHNLNGVEVGYNYLITPQSSLFANYTRGFQAPNIDYFFKADYTFYPTITYKFNKFISPMKSDNFTVGYNNIQSNNKLKISAYYIKLKDEIYLDKTSGGYNNTNIDKSHKYGLDIYDKYLINQQFNVALNYNYVQAIIDEEKADNGTLYKNTKLPGVSNHSVKAVLDYLPNKYTTLSLTEIYRSKAYAQDDFANNFTQKQDAYTSTDISVTYARDNYEVFAKINNLFNQKNGLWTQDDVIYPYNYTTTALVGLKLKY